MTVERHGELMATAEGVATLPVRKEDRGSPPGQRPGRARRSRSPAGSSDAALAEVLPQIRQGMSERMLATLLDHAMALLGRRPSRVRHHRRQSGPNGAIPHHAPTGRELERGDLVTMDFGALYDGYHADMTRTVAIGAVGRLAAGHLRPGRARPEAGIAVLRGRRGGGRRSTPRPAR